MRNWVAFLRVLGCSWKIKIRWCGTSKTWFSHRVYCKNQDFHHSGNSAKIIEMRPTIIPKLTQNVTNIHAKTHPKATPKTTLEIMYFGNKNNHKMKLKLVQHKTEINPSASRGAPWTPKTEGVPGAPRDHPGSI